MDLTLDIALPARFIRNRRTTGVADAFELAARPAATVVLAPTTVRVDPGQLIYLVGASGSGKSQVLRALAAAWPPAAKRRLTVLAQLPASPPRAGDCVLDHVCRASRCGGRGSSTEVDRALRLLACAGLAEARIWLRSARTLSAGQADRLALACLYARIESLAAPRLRVPSSPRPPFPLLLIDEFGSRLDRLTASILAANLRRWVNRTGNVAVVVATAHDDLADSLQPDWIWVKTMEQDLGITKRHRASGIGKKSEK